MGQLLEDLLVPVSEDSPCGPYVEEKTELYTRYNELESAATGKPEQVMGDAVIAAVEPNWGRVQDLSTALLKDTKDLRVAKYLTLALLKKNCFQGLRDGLTLICSFLENYWETVHPQLVIDGDDDPDYRINAVSEIGGSDFISCLSNSTLVAAKAVGRFTLKDYRIASGIIKPVNSQDQESKPDMSLINAAFLNVDLEDLQINRAAAGEASETLIRIAKIFDEKLATVSGPQIEALSRELRDVIRIFDDSLAQRGAAVTDEAQDDAAPTGDSEMTEQQTSGNIAAVSGDIHSREDVIKQIDRICKYYEKHEPSSPVPLVLNRARKLVTMDFLDIIKDVSPESLQAITSLAGLKE